MIIFNHVFVKPENELPNKRILACIIDSKAELHHCYYNADMQIWTPAHIGEKQFHAYEIEYWTEIQSREEFEEMKEKTNK